MKQLRFGFWNPVLCLILVASFLAQNLCWANPSLFHDFYEKKWDELLAPDGVLHPPGCEELLDYVMNKSRFVHRHILDERTISDLNLKEVREAMFGPYTPRTLLGAKRLEHLMSYPLLDVELVRFRQGLVQELIQNQTLRESLREVLNSIAPLWDEQLYANFFSKKTFSSMADSEFVSPKLSAANTINFIVLLGVGMLAYLSSGFKGNSKDLLLPVFCMLAAFLSVLTPASYHQRKGYEKYRKLFKELQSMEAVLKNSEHPLFQKLANLFSSLNDPNHEYALKEAVEKFKFAYGTRLLLPADFFQVGIYLGDYYRKILTKHFNEFSLVFSSLADLDVLLTFADTYLARPNEMSFPEIHEPKDPKTGEPLYFFHIKQGHHPIVFFSDQERSRSVVVETKNGREIERQTKLIVVSKRRNRRSVRNEFSLVTKTSGDGQNTLVITGPNAAGKSTYIRMIGVTAILAQMGAPVLGHGIHLTPLKVITSIENKDSVQLKKSFFDAESDRVIDIMRVASREEQGMLVILDEILRGTNPSEKHALETAYLESFKDLANLYVLATHDQEIAAIAQTLGIAKNVHVTAEYKDRKFHFPYTIQKGPAKTSNAIDMMESKGADSDVIRRARQIFKESLKEKKKPRVGH